MFRKNQKRPLKFNSVGYYIDEVVSYRAMYRDDECIAPSYPPPVVMEMLLAILISVRAIRGLFSVLVGFLLGLMLAAIF